MSEESDLALEEGDQLKRTCISFFLRVGLAYIDKVMIKGLAMGLYIKINCVSGAVAIAMCAAVNYKQITV